VEHCAPPQHGCISDLEIFVEQRDDEVEDQSRTMDSREIRWRG
jgi:hypothetical protein